MKKFTLPEPISTCTDYLAAGKINSARTLLQEVIRKLVYELTQLSTDHKEVVHYTSMDGMLKILQEMRDAESPAFRMYSTEHFNDPEEGRFPYIHQEVDKIYSSITKKFNWLKKPVLKQSEHAYVCCFSSPKIERAEDNLMFWRLYGDDGKGCSIKTKLNALKESIIGRNSIIAPVQYRNWGDRENNKKNMLKGIKRILVNLNGWVEQTNAQHLFTESVCDDIWLSIQPFRFSQKSEYYKHEEELRCIRFEDSNAHVEYDTTIPNQVRRYVPGPLLKKLFVTGSVITVGPAVKSPDIVKNLLVNELQKIGIGKERTLVTTSKARYKNP